MAGKIFLIGHRGAAALEPENTLRAFRKGIECKADAIEFDVRKTKDGKLAVIHDAELWRTTNGKGFVKDFTLEELKRLNAGKGEEMPELGETLEFIKAICGEELFIYIILEIKEEGTEEAIAEIVDASGMKKNVIFVSFSPASVRAMKNFMPGSVAGIIFSTPPLNPVGLAEDTGADILLPKYTILSKELVEKAHRNGILVYTWTLNATSAMENAVSLGVDGFASDDPCKAREFLKKRGYA